MEVIQGIMSEYMGYLAMSSIRVRVKRPTAGRESICIRAKQAHNRTKLQWVSTVHTLYICKYGTLLFPHKLHLHIFIIQDVHQLVVDEVLS